MGTCANGIEQQHRPARLAGSLTFRFGAVARWWRVHRSDLAKDAIIGLVVGVVLFLGACWWDARLQARQDAFASAIADRQDDLARDLANQAEVLENTRFVRQIATSDGDMTKPFASINLVGAQLEGLSLRCTDVKRHLGCANFSKADLHEANLDSTDLSGANFNRADLRKVSLHRVNLGYAELGGANLDGVSGESILFDWTALQRTSLVQARIDDAIFTDSILPDAIAHDAVLRSAYFRNVNLEKSHFERADLRNANFWHTNMTRIDLTSADLRNSSFRDTKLTRANLTSADLRGASFTRADLSKAVLTDVCFDDTTKWGSNTPPASSSC